MMASAKFVSTPKLKVGEAVPSRQTLGARLIFGETSLHCTVNVGGVDHGSSSFSFGTALKRVHINATNVSAEWSSAGFARFVSVRARVCGLAHDWTGKMRIFRLCPSAAGTTAAKAREGLA